MTDNKQPAPFDAITNPVVSVGVTTGLQLPMPREFNGKKYYGVADVARILGVTQQAVSKWQNKLFMGAPIFTADERAHDGRYLYEVERVMQLKAVYRPDWNQPVYLERVTETVCTPVVTPTLTTGVQPTTSDLANSTRPKKTDYRDLADKLKRISPAELIRHGIIKTAPNFRETMRQGYVCPWCGSGERDNETGAGTFDENNMFYCHACKNEFANGHKASAIDIFAHVKGLDAKNEFAKVCDEMADEFNTEVTNVVRDNNPDKPKKSEKDSAFKAEYLKLIAEDIRDAQTHELPPEVKRGLTDATIAHFKLGYIKNWVLTKSRAAFNYGIYIDKNGKTKSLPPASARVIVPTSNTHFNAVATPNARKSMDKDFWKQHAGEIELFNSAALDGKPKYIIGVEGEFDCMSIWQATSGKAPVVAIIGGNKRYLLEALDQRQITDIKVILIFDNDNGQKNAEAVMKALETRSIPVVNAIFDDFMTDEQRALFGGKIDANAILEKLGDETLNQLVKKIVSAAADAFKNPTQKVDAPPDEFTIRINEWQKFNGKIPSDFTDKIRDAVTLLKNITVENVSAADVKSSKFKFAAALCRFYDFNDTADNFLLTVEAAKSAAAEKIKAAKDNAEFVTQPDANLKAVAALSLREIKTSINSIVTDLKRNHKKYQESLKLNERRRREQNKIDNRQSERQNTLTEDEISYLFSLENTDADHAERAKIILGDTIAFMPDQEIWYVFDERQGLWRRGQKRSTSIIMPAAARVAKVLAENAPNPVDFPDSVKTVDDWRSTKKVSLAFTYLKSEESIIITREDLDAHKNLLNCKNGVLDLQTGTFYPNCAQNAKFRLSKQINAIYQRGVYSEIVDRFFKSLIRDEATRRALFRYLGYTLTGETNQHKAHFWKGGGSNGKSTLMNLILYFFATYGAKIGKNVFVDSDKPLDPNAATAGLNPIAGARFAAVNEFKKKDVFRADLFKDLTGDDYIYLRNLNQEGYQTIPTAKFVFSSNFPPKLDNINDEGLKRRILVIEFKEIFSEALGNIDRQLPDKLRTPEALTGLLSLLADEAREFYRTNSLLESNDMSVARKSYINDNDFIAEFIEEYCILKPNVFVPGDELVEALRDKYKVQTSQFKNKELRAMFKKFSDKITYGRHGKRKTMCFSGIALAGETNFTDSDDDGDDDFDYSIPPPLSSETF